MPKTYEQFSAETRSNKVILCHLEPQERLLLWTVDTGSTYYRDVSHFTIDVLEDGTSLTEASSSTLTSGQWFYNSETARLYVRMSDDSNPNTKVVVGTYRKFYASIPADLPYDLSSGADVNYEGRVLDLPDINKELDDEQIGIALESGTTVKLINEDGHFESMFDRLFWEYKAVKIYSWSESIPVTEAKLLFDGIIQDKGYDPSQVSFSCKDFMFKLREPVNMTFFSSSDGNVSDSYINTPKRRIYGQVQNARCVPIDSILDGFTLTGTLSGTNASATITGTGTSFLSECSPQDKILYTVNSQDFEFEIESVDSDTQLTLTETINDSFSGVTVKNKPVRPYRQKNRNWHIAGHKLREPSTTVVTGTQPNRFTVASTTDLFAGDLIDVNGEDAFIKRISGSQIILTANLQAGTPSASDPVSKNPVSAVFVNENEAFINRDWTVTNTTESILNFDALAEFNIARQRTMAGSLSFTNGSRVVTATNVNLKNEIQTRDWIQGPDTSHTTWYEVLTVDEDQLEVRVAYAGANTSGTAKKKNVELIDDNSIITVNCIGYERSGAWVKTGSDVVLDLVQNDAAITSIDTTSFSDADEAAPFIMSLIIPEDIGGGVPKIRDVITKVNESIFGSLVNNSSWQLSYNVLTPDRPTDLTELFDDDIIGEVRVRTKNEIVRKVNVKYRPFIDRFNEGEPAFKLYEFTNTFVDNFIGAKAELDKTIYLYNDTDAQQIAQRYALYNSLSQSTVSVKAKLNLTLKNLNDKMWLNLRRLYVRFGGVDRRKIGIISSIKKDGKNVDVEFNDLGNVFNRVMTIAPDTANDFTSASESEKILYGYICDDSLEVPDTSSDTEIGSYIIG